MTPARTLGILFVAVLLAGPFLPLGVSREYTIHVLVQIFIWSFIGGAWSLMGRFGLTSLGHGAFLGIGAYTTTLLWNFFDLTPWLGTLLAVALTAIRYAAAQNSGREPVRRQPSANTPSASGMYRTWSQTSPTPALAPRTRAGGEAAWRIITRMGGSPLALASRM